MTIIKKIAVFGDSILRGIQLNPQNNQYTVDNHIDVQRISRMFSVTINNYSKFGSTILKGQKMLYHHLENNADYDAVLMNYGGNDANFNWQQVAMHPLDEHLPATPLQVFVKTYTEVVHKLKQMHITPILATLPPMDAQKFFDWFCKDINKENVLKWLGSVSGIYRYQENYSLMVEKIARQAQVPLVDLRGAFLKYRRIDNLLCEDGIHPNTAGQKVISDAFLRFATQMARCNRNQITFA